MLVCCATAAACGTDDKALRALGPSGVTVTTVGAAGGPPVNPLPPPLAGPQVVQPGAAGIGGTKESLPDPFGASGTLTGAAGSPAITTTPIIGAAGTGL
jgi:hypothetical protein